MFDIAFSELVVIAIVALIVIGPEKLPKVARTLGTLAGRMQKYMAQIKEEVNREARFAELQKLQDEIRSAGNAAQEKLQSEAGKISQDLQISEAEGAKPALDKQPNPNPDKE
ncbi:Sec-independent protein translocase protein TatB [Methylotenera sp. G11]|uniref:Sec-independent protein translocase protein TatB n=1 Tax=Methylotenera sp. G11 TaxID=1506585 RepID=UPI0006894DEF|nr:Sec-independent protein translocase protein TatB [Methylotenera sp. G11]